LMRAGIDCRNSRRAGWCEGVKRGLLGLHANSKGRHHAHPGDDDPAALREGRRCCKGRGGRQAALCSHGCRSASGERYGQPQVLGQDVFSPAQHGLVFDGQKSELEPFSTSKKNQNGRPKMVIFIQIPLTLGALVTVWKLDWVGVRREERRDWNLEVWWCASSLWRRGTALGRLSVISLPNSSYLRLALKGFICTWVPASWI